MNNIHTELDTVSPPPAWECPPGKFPSSLLHGAYQMHRFRRHTTTKHDIWLEIRVICEVTFESETFDKLQICNKLISIFGNVQFNWPTLFQAFFVKFTVIFFHECVHSIIPHQHTK